MSANPDDVNYSFSAHYPDAVAAPETSVSDSSHGGACCNMPGCCHRSSASASESSSSSSSLSTWLKVAKVAAMVAAPVLGVLAAKYLYHKSGCTFVERYCARCKEAIKNRVEAVALSGGTELASPQSQDRVNSVTLASVDLDPSFDEVAEGFKRVQDNICRFLAEETGEEPHEDLWVYSKGEGGGRTRVWEGGENLEKGGVNFSAIKGGSLPTTAASAIKIPPGTQFRATGVSIVIHPRNPIVPTIHMNIRLFEAGDKWWFGGGIDLTPYCPKRADVARFHACLRDVCNRFDMDFAHLKRQADDYFTLRHRGEMRGVGGIFYDHLRTDRRKNFEFCVAVGECFIRSYRPFLRAYLRAAYTARQREFQLLRRGRYVEFNLVYDRGTKFGLESNGRTESILMSLPSTAIWRYGGQLHRPEGESEEGVWGEAQETEFNTLFIHPHDWASEWDATPVAERLPF